MTDVKVNDRVSVDGCYGTIKFIGPIPPTSGDWIGIEWDDPSRGKHDGSKDGVSYFKCRHPTGGSFVRRAKLNLGISICDAIRDRYACPAGASEMGDSKMFMVTTKGGYKKVDAVGLDKVLREFSELTKLKQVGLRDLLISSPGLPGELESLTQSLLELDISKNLLSTWMSACSISAQLPHLHTFNLSENYLSFHEECLKYKDAFTSVKTLILNKCRFTWNDVIACAQLWPHMPELHLSGNCITTITPPAPDLLPQLTFLHLSDNIFESWDEVTKLSSLPKLEKLFLTGCGLSEIKCNEHLFPHLKEIGLAQNKFATHDVFNELNKLPALTDVIFRKNPINEKEEYEVTREIVVAKMKRLQRLNHTALTDHERDSAEMDYLKKFGLYWLESGGDQDPDKNNPSQQFLLDHPRYMDLVAEYGAPGRHELVKKTTALKGNLIEIVIEAPVKDDFKPVTRRLPLSMTVANLKMLIQRLTKVEVRKQSLVYISKENPDHVVALDRDYETLHDVSIEPGDTVRVQEPTQFDLLKYIASRRKMRMFQKQP